MRSTGLARGYIGEAERVLHDLIVPGCRDEDEGESDRPGEHEVEYGDNGRDEDYNRDGKSNMCCGFYVANLAKDFATAANIRPPYRCAWDYIHFSTLKYYLIAYDELRACLNACGY